jgi:predicted nucleic acid-binding protein
MLSFPMSEFFSRPVVCNTGPIIALSRASLGHLLPKLFPRVLITETIRAELTAKDAGDSSEIEKTLLGLEVVDTGKPDALLTTELDSGEASVIHTACVLGVTGVLIDERRARRIASEVYGLEVRGTCALLLKAKRSDLLGDIRPHLSMMIDNGYFIGPRLMEECLRLAGE